jgi:hypothetical protein
MSKYLDFYHAKISGDEELFLDHYGADVSSQISAQLATAKTQRSNALKQLSNAISELEKVRKEIRRETGKIRPVLKAASEGVFANKSRARMKIEKLVSPDKAREAKRLRFVFPLAIAVTRGLGGSKFKNLRPALKDSFKLSFDLMGYIGGVSFNLISPSIRALKKARSALKAAPIPSSVSSVAQLNKVISNCETATKVVDVQLGEMQKILTKLKSSYVPKMTSVIQRSGSIFKKVLEPLNFIIKTLNEAPKSRDAVKASRKKKRKQRRNKRKNRRGSNARLARDKQKILNKIRPSMRAKRSRELTKMLRPHKKFVKDAISTAKDIRNKIPGQVNQAISQMQQAQSALKQISQTLKQAQSVMGSGNMGSFNKKKGTMEKVGIAGACLFAVGYYLQDKADQDREDKVANQYTFDPQNNYYGI